MVVNEPGVSTELIVQAGQFRNGAWDPAVLRRTELCLLDSLGCYSAGLSLKHCAPSLAIARGLLGPFALAYVYGQAANALDCDDTLFGHPGAPIVGAVLSVGARCWSNGRTRRPRCPGISCSRPSSPLLTVATFTETARKPLM